MKKLLIVVAGFIVLIGFAFVAMYFYTKSFSPKQIVAYAEAPLDLKIVYCQPSKKGRIIFGGLVPYGVVWRTGANEATIFETASAIMLGDQRLEAGRYSLYSIPDEQSWTIIINRQTGQWGTVYKPEEDLIHLQVPSTSKAPFMEMFTISFDPLPDGAQILFHWDTTLVKVPVKPAS